MRDATECINSLGYALFAVIKAIFNNPNGLKMIMKYIQTSVSINKHINKNINTNKTRYKDRVRTRNFHDSGQAIHLFSLRLISAKTILDVIECMYYSKIVS